MKPHVSVRIGELSVSSGLFVLGLYVLVQTRSVEEMRRYEQVGPRFFPYMVGAGLIILGAVLAWQAASGGWRNLPLDQEGHDSPNWVAALVISIGGLLHMALIGWAGFILAGIVLFTLVARAFGSSRPLLDAGIAAALSSGVFYLFTEFLGLSLPVGLLGGF